MRNLRPATVHQKRRCLARLERAWGDPITLGVDQLRAHLAREMLPESRATELSHLRSFYRWAAIEGHIAIDPTVRIQRPKVPRRLPRPISEGNLAMALELAGGRVRYYLHLAAFAGLRAQEISAVRGEHVEWDLPEPVLRVCEQKGGDEASVPLAPILAELLRELPAVGWWFPRHDGQAGHRPPWLVSREANLYLHGLGISDTLHSLRHRFGTQVYRASGRDLRLTQELMRHATPVSTAIYTWVDPAEGASVVAKLPTF